MDETKSVTLAWLVLAVTLAEAVLYDPREDPRGWNHAKVLPGSYLVVNGIESFNDVLWYEAREPFSVPQPQPSTTTTTTTAAPPTQSFRSNLVRPDSTRHRHRGLPTLDGPSGYEFGYGVRDFGHEERRGLDSARGQYRVLLPDGRLQIVDYEADGRGFRPSVRYKDTGRAKARTFRTY